MNDKQVDLVGSFGFIAAIGILWTAFVLGSKTWHYVVGGWAALLVMFVSLFWAASRGGF